MKGYRVEDLVAHFGEEAVIAQFPVDEDGKPDMEAGPAAVQRAVAAASALIDSHLKAAGAPLPAALRPMLRNQIAAIAMYRLAVELGNPVTGLRPAYDIAIAWLARVRDGKLAVLAAQEPEAPPDESDEVVEAPEIEMDIELLPEDEEPDEAPLVDDVEAEELEVEDEEPDEASVVDEEE